MKLGCWGLKLTQGGKLRLSPEGDFLLMELPFPLVWSYPLKKKRREKKVKRKKKSEKQKSTKRPPMRSLPQAVFLGEQPALAGQVFC